MAILHEVLFNFLLVLIFCGAEGYNISVKVDSEGYYWREYSGVIPYDALQGGPDVNGDPMYIGQTIFLSSYYPVLVPGPVNAANKTLSLEWGNIERKMTKRIKILCSDHPEKLVWEKININEIEELENKTLVLGGFYQDRALYIGRIMVDGGVEITKVDLDDLESSFNTTEHETFEILSYNKHIPYIIVQSLESEWELQNSAERGVAAWSIVSAIIVSLRFLL